MTRNVGPFKWLQAQFSSLYFSFLLSLSFFLSFFCWTLHGWKGMPIIIYHWFFLKTILHEQKTWFHVLQTLFTKILKLTNLFSYRTCKILFMISINKIFKLTLKLVWIPSNEKCLDKTSSLSSLTKAVCFIFFFMRHPRILTLELEASRKKGGPGPVHVHPSETMKLKGSGLGPLTFIIHNTLATYLEYAISLHGSSCLQLFAYV